MQIPNNLTKLYGIIGYPLNHTRSPYIHNTWFKKKNINALYLVFEHQEENFRQFITGLKEIGIQGFNVTLPYKQKIMKYLDELDDEANHIGAVNTVVRKENKLIGYNTDAYGFFQAFKKAFPNSPVKSRKVLLLGAGGASPAVAYALLSRGADVTIANRTLAKAKKLQKRLDLLFPQNVKTLALDFQILKENNNFDFIVNTTSYGLKGEKKPLISLESAKRGTKIFDIIYGVKTPLIQAAMKRNFSFSDGKMMLIYQAEKAFRIWGFPKPDISLVQ